MIRCYTVGVLAPWALCPDRNTAQRHKAAPGSEPGKPRPALHRASKGSPPSLRALKKAKSKSSSPLQQTAKKLDPNTHTPSEPPGGVLLRR